jgi:hypothetical protein
VTALVGPFVLYAGPTAYGSSGAAVFNGQWKLVAMHQRRTVVAGSAGSGTALTSQGVCIQAIAADIRGWSWRTPD